MYADGIFDALMQLIVSACVLWAVLYLVTKQRSVLDFMTAESHSKRDILVLVLIGGVLDILASEFSFLLFGVNVNVRNSIAIFFGIVGGPAAGIGVGLIGGAYRTAGVWWSGFTGNLGYMTALGCGIATIGAGFVGARLNKGGIDVMRLDLKNVGFVVFVVAMWEIIDMLVINPLLVPFFSDLDYAGALRLLGENMLLPMILGNCFTIFVLALVAIDTVKNRKMEMERLELLEKMVSKYEEYIGPVAKTIAKDVIEKEKK